MSGACACRIVKRDFPVTWDQSACPTHGPNAPRFHIDHGVIHDNVTGQHVRTDPDGTEPGVVACCVLLNGLSGRVRELEEAIGVMVPTIIRAFLSDCAPGANVDREAAEATLARVERAMLRRGTDPGRGNAF